PNPRMGRAAPRWAAATTRSPTPPQPMTHTLSPGFTFATLRTAPNPVMTPHPTRAASHKGSARGMGMADASGTTAYSAKQDTKLKCLSDDTSADCRRIVPSSMVPRYAYSPDGSHSVTSPFRQARQPPQKGTMESDTWSPAATWVTPSPTASTTPAPS